MREAIQGGCEAGPKAFVRIELSQGDLQRNDALWIMPEVFDTRFNVGLEYYVK